MATTAQKVIWLEAAEKAYHQLMLGGGVRVTVDQNGERVEFTAANRAALLSYIQSLKRELGLLPPLAPAGVIF